MDRSHWMYNIGHCHPTYLSGVQSLLKLAEDDRMIKGNETIPCPCRECKNFTEFKETKDIEYHLIKNGFMYNYTCWSKHGESLANRCTTSTDSVSINEENNEPHISVDSDNLNDDNDNLYDRNDNLNDMLDDLETNIGNNDQEKLQQIFIDSEKPLYDGCNNFSKLDAVLKLLNLKAKYGWSDTSFTSLLVLLHDMLPKDNELPISLYQAKKLTCPMGLEVKRIHACPNDCILYRNEFENSHTCFRCHASKVLVFLRVVIQVDLQVWE